MKDSGGFAFPAEGPSQGQFENPGMSLRAWLAGKALSGWISTLTSEEIYSYGDDDRAFAEHQHEVAKTCLGYADAMIEELFK